MTLEELDQLAPQAVPQEVAGGMACTLVAGCQQPHEIAWSHPIGDEQDLEAVAALPWPTPAHAPLQLGDRVAVYACHQHVPSGVPHVCGQA